MKLIDYIFPIHKFHVDIFYFALVVSFCWVIFYLFVSGGIEGFYDFSGYNSYIIDQSATVRFVREPISALLMRVSGYFGGAREFYLIVGFIYVVSVCLFFRRNCIRFWVIAALLLILSPVSLIFYQTPRSNLSFSFILLAYCWKSYRLSVFFIILAILSHTITGVFGAGLFFALHLRFIYFCGSLIVMAIVFYSLLNGLIFDYWSFYDVDYRNTGEGRLIYLLLLLFILVLIFKFSRKAILAFTLFYFFCISLYYMTPFAHRLLFFPVSFSFLYIFSRVRKTSSFLLMIAFFAVNILISVWMINFGLYGYG